MAQNRVVLKQPEVPTEYLGLLPRQDPADRHGMSDAVEQPEEIIQIMS
jgi:hypothetical protein